MTALLDTNGVVVLANDRDAQHAAVASALRTERGSVIVPSTILAEVDYLTTRRFGALAAIALLRRLVAGDFQIEIPTSLDLARSLELMRQYADSNIGFVDASIVAIAERLGVRRILTLDRRHFGIIRPRHCDAFTLLP